MAAAEYQGTRTEERVDQGGHPRPGSRREHGKAHQPAHEEDETGHGDDAGHAERRQRRRRGLDDTAQEREPTEHPDGESPQLPRSPRKEQREGEADDGDTRPRGVGRERAGHPPHGLGDDRHRHDLQTRDHAGGDGAAEHGGSPGERDEKDGGGKGESEECGERAEHSGPLEPHREAHLARGRTGEELAERHEIGVRPVVHPLPAHDEVVTEVPEVRDGPTERGEAETKEGEEHLADGTGPLHRPILAQRGKRRVNRHTRRGRSSASTSARVTPVTR